MRAHPLLLSLVGLAALALLAPVAAADTLTLKDGRIVEGVVARDGANYLVLSRFGSTEIPGDDVEQWIKAKPVDQQIQEHLATLDAEDTANRALLATWLQEIGRVEEAAALAEAVIALDPENAKAHELLGHVRHRGVWCTPDEAKRAEGLERHGDEWYTPAEWKNLAEAEKEKAAAAEQALAAKALNRDVNQAVRLMLSPDPIVRARGKARLERLAAEHDSDFLREAVKNIEAYVQQLADVRKKAASIGGAGVSGTGTVMGEIRATLSRLKRPIRTFETSLASNIGGAPVRIQLPELEVVKVRTTGIIPVVVK